MDLPYHPSNGLHKAGNGTKRALERSVNLWTYNLYFLLYTFEMTNSVTRLLSPYRYYILLVV